jgi:hypothetical protein
MIPSKLLSQRLEGGEVWLNMDKHTFVIVYDFIVR